MTRTSSSRKFLGTGWNFPLRITPAGGLSFSCGEQNVEEAIWILLGTARGERQMLSRFGCGIHDLVRILSKTRSTNGSRASMFSM